MTPKSSSAITTITEIKPQKQPYEVEIVWKNVFLFTLLHIAAFSGLYCFVVTAKWSTFFWSLFLVCVSIEGASAGAHRLWCHRSYKAKLPLRILLCIWQTHGLQNDIYEWVRDHRTHHKYVDTDADPHNSRRGFFFCHMGWLMCRKHSDVIAKGRTIDMSDLEADPVVMFQKKYYMILAPLFAFIIPTWVPWYFWNEDIYISWLTAAMFRYTAILHGVWAINSVGHMWGTKPYDKNIHSVENTFINYLTGGEGCHNYHHTFPWDYKSAEFGTYHSNPTSTFIDFMAKIGWAYDRKSVSVQLIEHRARRTGDGSRKQRKDVPLWGWGDKDMNENDMKIIETVTVYGWGDEDMKRGERKLTEICH